MGEPLERHFANMDRLVALERDLAEARRELADLDLVLPAACGSRVDAVATMADEIARLTRDRDYERGRYEEVRRQVAAARALSTDAQAALRSASAEALRCVGVERERDEARAEVERLRAERDEIDGDKCKLSLVLRDTQRARAALRERVAELEAALAKVRPDVCREESIDALDEALRGAPSPEAMAREIADAEERGARWVLEAIAAKVSDSEARGKGWGGTGWWRGCEDRNDFDAARICREARERGEHG